MRAVLVAGGHNMLRQSRMGQVEGAVRIGKNAGVFRRRDLKGRMAHPFHRYRRGGAGGRTVDSALDHIELVTEG
jgi:hypothetical protein